MWEEKYYLSSVREEMYEVCSAGILWHWQKQNILNDMKNFEIDLTYP